MLRIAANVRASEALYRNREISAQLVYKGEESKSYRLPRLIESSSGSYRVVLQGDYMFINVDEPFVTKDGQTNCGDTLRGYDGEKTRIVEQRAICNLVTGRQEDSRAYLLSAHNALFARTSPLHVCFPFQRSY